MYIHIYNHINICLHSCTCLAPVYILCDFGTRTGINHGPSPQEMPPTWHHFTTLVINSVIKHYAKICQAWRGKAQHISTITHRNTCSYTHMNACCKHMQSTFSFVIDDFPRCVS